MNIEGDEDSFSDSYQESGEYPEEYGSDEEESVEEDLRPVLERDITVGIARIPASLQDSIADILHTRDRAYTRDWVRSRLPRAWMIAIGHSFPDTPLAKVRSTDPSLLPGWLLQGFGSYQVRFERRILGSTGR
jgi:hypothetical protein